ncbi:hypothetical protein RIF29_12903 [Crotalaria pallida]|uniref:Uncharacterized protein n=1 Tax=Crotalaria pallida TaxID=3830 RepID=A0AAN9INU0_CROPI
MIGKGKARGKTRNPSSTVTVTVTVNVTTAGHPHIAAFFTEIGLADEYSRILMQFSAKYTTAFILPAEEDLGPMFILGAYQLFGEFLIRLQETPALQWVTTDRQLMNGYLRSLHSFGFKDSNWKPALLKIFDYLEETATKVDALRESKESKRLNYESELLKYQEAISDFRDAKKRKLEAKKRKLEAKTILDSADEYLYEAAMALKAPLNLL